MRILAFFTSSGTPVTGLSPTIRIRNLSDNSLVITDAVMSEVGDGNYQYNFTSYDKDIDYAIRCDGGITLNASDRYTYAGNENYIDDISDTITETTSANFDTINNNVLAASASIVEDLVEINSNVIFYSSDVNTKIESLSASNEANFNNLNTNIIGVSAQNVSIQGTVQTILSNQYSLSASYPTVQEIVDGVWDEPLTGATHNVSRSAGRRLRQLSDVVITDGTAVGAGNGINQIELNGDAFTTDGAYDPAMIAIVEGTGAGQCRNILEYDGATKTATVDRNWKTIPDNTSEYIIYADSGREHVNEGLLTGATLNTATLNAYASSADNVYRGQFLFIRSGRGDDQSCIVASYDGATKTVTLEHPWKIIPDTTSAYVMLPQKLYPTNVLRDMVWNAPTSGYGVSGSYGDLIQNSDTNILAASANIRSDIAQVASDVWDEQLADHTILGTYGNEVATKADIGILFGVLGGGSYLDTFVRDGIYWHIEESAVNGLTAQMSFNIPDGNRAGVVKVFGRYMGVPSTTHYIELWAYNYESMSWEQLSEIFLPGGNTSDSEYTHEYFERHIDRDNNNEVKIRFVHNVTTYIASHDMYLDYVAVTSIDVITAADIANAVWSENPSGYSGTDNFGGIVNQINSNVVTLSNDMKRLLGLTHENIFIDNPVYDGDGNLTSARVRIYSNPASVGTLVDVIGTYTISAPSTAPGQFTTWQQVRIG